MQSSAKDFPLVTVIMPAYNAERFIADAINSVRRQTFENWELIVVNDGSTDNTKAVVLSIIDSRIRYFEQPNHGVSNARNHALQYCAGDYIVFLDADDELTPDSLRLRAELAEANPHIAFVDGHITITKTQLTDISRTWMPSFRGRPLKELMTLSETTFLTLSWMIRRSIIGEVRFREGVTHGEDLIFLVELASRGVYDYVSAPVMYFRRTGQSAMSNIDGLARGYVTMFQIFSEENLFPSSAVKMIFKLKVIKIMLLTYIRRGELSKALRFLYIMLGPR